MGHMQKSLSKGLNNKSSKPTYDITRVLRKQIYRTRHKFCVYLFTLRISGQPQTASAALGSLVALENRHFMPSIIACFVSRIMKKRNKF